MKTTEFIKAVEELGFITASTTKLIRVKDQEGIGLVLVRKDKWLELDTLWNPGVTEQLFDLAVDYAKTPIDEREEPKKYHLKHKYLHGNSTFNFLNLNKDRSFYSLSTNKCSAIYQTEFTQEEIDNFPFEVIANEWELIEVTK